ncbi:tRNA guanosine(15) transglycosylase TgtA [Halodesulfurarchaeum sp.]|uniref:tRNA guanosine(15) transglycosylase TgtA n=1 Tax=Halodesulfurarchaeum sp. TaxID=1980530 RepID=UPI002FC3B41E
MADSFEIRSQDASGRIGDLQVPRADRTVRTPALLPVVNPHYRTIDPDRFEAFGVEMLITNAYIIYQDEELRAQAKSEGLHEVIGFDGPIMTDSGSFQLAEYGDISVSTEEILSFQTAIGSDIGTPVDIPTHPDADRETVTTDLAETERRLEIAASVETEDMLVTAPVQGGTLPDLREQAGATAAETELDVFPIGAVVPLLNNYRYADVVEQVMAAKRGLGTAAPVHLFGAGHPMTFALAAAMGCDLFDSAAYALFAREGRYLTVRGTKHLEDLQEFPCSCPVCTNHEPSELRDVDEETRTRLLAEHNLHVSMAEIRRIRSAIRDGSLLELVEARAHAHPSLLDGYRTLLEHVEHLETHDRSSKSTFFYLSADSAHRPEVLRHHDRLDRLTVEGSLLLTEGRADDRFATTWRLKPPFGPIPPGLTTTYPLTAEVPEQMDTPGYVAAAEGVTRLVEANPETSVTVAQRQWPDRALAKLPESVTIERLGRNP